MGKVTNFRFQETKQQKNKFRESYLEAAEMMRQIKDEDALLSDEERELKKQKLDAEFEKIIEMGEAAEENKKHIPDKSRVKLFNEYVETANMLAQECLLDVITEITEKGMGIIRFRFEYMFLTEDVPIELRTLFATLIAMSNDMHLGALSREEYENEYHDLPHAEGKPLQLQSFVYSTIFAGNNVSFHRK